MDYDIEMDAMEPPVPANLHNLTAPLRAFVDFFEIDDDLLAVKVDKRRHGTGHMDYEYPSACLAESKCLEPIQAGSEVA